MSTTTTAAVMANMYKNRIGSDKGKPMPPMPSAKLKGGSKTKKSTKSAKVSKKKSKKPMPKDSAYCLNPKCRKQVKMLTHKERTTKNGRKQLVGKGECGHDVYRFI